MNPTAMYVLGFISGVVTSIVILICAALYLDKKGMLDP